MKFLTLTESILAKNPSADRKVLEELNELVEKHNINWFPNREGNSAYFVMSELSVAKGLDANDYRKHYAGNPEDKTADLTTAEKGLLLEPLPGKDFRLVKENLANFKQIYLEATGKSLGKIPSLYVGDWLRAFSYLVQGRSETAKDFQTLGANTIEKAITKEITQIDEEMNASDLRHSYRMSEEELQDQLILLSAHCGQGRLLPEVPVADFLQSKCNSRRFDLVGWYPHKTLRKVVTIYELKKDVIDFYDVISTVEGKRYIELSKRAYNTEAVNLVFVAPFGGTPEARFKASELGVKIITVADLAHELIERARRQYKIAPEFVYKTLIPRFEKLLSNPALPPTRPPASVPAPKLKGKNSNLVQFPLDRASA